MNGLRAALIILLLLAAQAAAACRPNIAPQAEAPPEPAAVSPATYWPTTGWQSNSPEAYGVDSAKLAQALLAMREQGIQIHSLLVIRDGQMLVDANFYPYDGSTVHDLASVTKSVMTTLIAIAADQGKLDLDQPMVSFFPERTIANRDALKEKITVRHLASMTSGLACMGFAQDEGTLSEMQASADYVQFALDRKVVTEPGAHFVYDSPGMHLLSAILQQATGMTALDFARANLFKPLGIEEVIWRSDPQGVNHGWGDLYLRPQDAAKIGYLWLNQGMWDGRRIVSADWVEAAHTVQIEVEERDDDYGYGWWVSPDDGVYTAAGRGGQYIKVIPYLNAMVVTTGGGYDYDEIDPLLTAALIDPVNPLPANSSGEAQLVAAVAAVVQPPDPQPVAPLPEIARTISGQTFVLDRNNPLEVDAVRLAFDDSSAAQLSITPAGGAELLTVPVGLDGVFRFVPGEFGLPQGARGRWEAGEVFAFELDGVANNDHTFIRVHFIDGTIRIEAQETAHELGVQVGGVLKTP